MVRIHTGAKCLMLGHSVLSLGDSGDVTHSNLDLTNEA